MKFYRYINFITTVGDTGVILMELFVEVYDNDSRANITDVHCIYNAWKNQSSVDHSSMSTSYSNIYSSCLWRFFLSAK